ncbi:2-hydroxyacid dehydrogenase [Tropicimonas sediminicola]|uniref:Lactate dehydrogenase n=1 Tax=Tropicimonas sediminicola TaxID=1031541 RepID=A0A239JVR9_9RHOB|nr:2-hydroxyacid dehydrogenase [Tropicimonas sediminicola]SNT10036.1 Lactate dehydrogenase [Tropicimonas sediminicola]
MTQPILIAIGKFRQIDIDAMRAEYELHLIDNAARIADLPAEAKAARAVAYSSHSPISGDEMDMLPGLEIIAHFGAGYDSIDVAAASQRGVKVTNTPDVLNDDVADLAVAMFIMQAREMDGADSWVRSGKWAERGAMPLARSASARKVGICGLGRIGREIADRLAAMKCEIHYHSRSPKDVPEGWTYHADPVALASAVDACFVALVGGAETEGYVSAAVIEALGPTGVLVNISRGSTVDEAAMLDALEAGRLGGAALDVFLDEPQIDPRFRALDNVLLAPHIGSATVQTRNAMGQLQRDNLAAFFAGKPLLTPVN